MLKLLCDRIPGWKATVFKCGILLFTILKDEEPKPQELCPGGMSSEEWTWDFTRNVSIVITKALCRVPLRYVRYCGREFSGRKDVFQLAWTRLPEGV